MRFVRLFTAFLAFTLVVSSLSTGAPAARAQTTEQAEQEADEAQHRANAASGLVDEAVANREDIELQLADSISRMNELAAQLSIVGADLDRLASQVGYADVELAGIKADIEDQAVDAYMTVVSSPSVAVVNTGTVEKALVASSVVEDVVADGRLTVDELSAKRKSLEELKQTYLADQEEFQELQEQVDAEVENYTALYEQADAAVATAIREADAAEREYLAALSAVDIAKAKEDERQRQENRSPAEPAPTTPPPPGTTPTTSPSGTNPPPTNAPDPTTTSTSGGGGGGPWNHPPSVEQWRGLVSQYFPSNRVEEALAIIDCESNGDPNALNPYSGASGLFQFLPSTWASTAPNAGFGGASPFDAEANIGSAAWLANRYQQLGKYYWQAWSCRRVLN
ncbi:MAG TPA: transglycosylase SLT domain-containing protein [Acidimicrobiia bacterium]|nr:transglycosylase SLT domain-containing protein [Acidimicrobiia bacterium]